ncbi:hypothetical protein DW322_03060 [Rhodococcus rhodnii]|uniref:Transposase n=1 Tax=Rhodococcus rhodnii TaxID=38312 RepID=A0A6P2CAP1_9NOCA|nr:hypothetical protein DW322_03060 [Rhodococcus rhodnii]
MGSVGAPRKYPEELKERATRLAVEACRDPGSKAGAIADRRSVGHPSRHPAHAGSAGRDRRWCPSGQHH